MEMVVRMEGKVADILDRLIGDGYFKTKTEALRAGVLLLGRQYGEIKSAQDIEDGLVALKIMQEDELIRKGKIKMIPLDEALKKAGIKRSDLK
ncbi:MAG: hypothetical protein V1835_04605 [Candidatus Micrarchaeota archaeon]